MPSSVLFIIASLIWGSTFWAITQQLGQVAPAVSIAYRFGLAALSLFVWCALRRRDLRLPWKLQKWLMLQGFFTFSLSYLCTYSSEQYVVSALVAVLFALMVIWSPLLEHLFFKKPLTLRIWIAAFISISGVVLLFYPALKGNWEETHSGHETHFLLGLGLALTATLASTFGNLVVVKIREQNTNVLLTMAWAMAWGTLWIACFATLSGEQWTIPETSNYWLSLLYLSLFGSVIAFACYFTLIHRIGAQKTVFIGVITPIISVLLSIQLENYHPGWIEWLGMILCLIGVVVALKSKSPS
ncbi:EamA family transporter [Undibacterium sp. LX40W]|uniref:EamA family transporter n=1 Tax=Undibacterium nitidum TaxID=2762298 RepID=A0A923KT04_9BURK|nr:MULTISPECIES: DMT family transporter [Undibacterium]MBC3881054.1 EamA family transporter [Undibacterium nitidum]MBC3890213.1 EamA family transporter [Undibacterium sp. LX40W]